VDAALKSGLIVAALWIFPTFSLIGVLFYARRWYHQRDRRNPLTRGLLRGPGHSLRELADDLRFDLLFYPAMLGAIPVVVLATYSMRAKAGGLTTVDWIFIALTTVGVLAFGGVKIFRITKRLRNIRLGFEAETAIGQELNLLMKDGFSVFHDLPGEKDFNIDHVLVGSTGVFAVETKGRAKPLRREDAETHRIRYDGRRLEFPGWSETKPLEQAQRNAEWLGK
jgi:hypothetical protein